MAENIVKYVRLLQIIELTGAADEIGGRKPPVGEMFEKHRIGHESRHRHDPPSSKGQKLFVQLPKIGDAMAMQIERVKPMQKSVAGTPRQYLRLALIERRPRPMLGLAIALEPCGIVQSGLALLGKSACR